MIALDRRTFGMATFAGALSAALGGPQAASASPSFLQNLISGIAGSSPLDLTFIPSIKQSQADIPGIGVKFVPDQSYVELYLESLRLTRARRFFSKFQGVVYSFVSLAREGQERAQLAGISKPDKLVQLDPSAVDRTITISRQLMGPTAYRGGSIDLQLGLFSVKNGDLLTPLLDYVTQVSSTAGISYVGAIKPFLPLITQGINLIAGQTQDTSLEVGLDTSFDPQFGTVAAIIDKPKQGVDADRLVLDRDRQLLYDGKPLDCGYAVFSLRHASEKTDFGEIPDLRDGYAALQTAIRTGRIKDAQDALGAFRLAAIASPDLTSTDATKLTKKATDKYEAAFPAGGSPESGQALRVETLGQIGLY